ncbi:hypothetical protein PM082_009824 [Marasmius tenuissimus]|nr:hypothetical protein PM082_009824 [Marasmius tenuissimus]
METMFACPSRWGKVFVSRTRPTIASRSILPRRAIRALTSRKATESACRSFLRTTLMSVTPPTAPSFRDFRSVLIRTIQALIVSVSFDFHDSVRLQILMIYQVCSKETQIQPGDTCEAIAARNNISISIIQELNPDDTCAGLLAFAQICVDGPANNCASIYVVTGEEGGCANIAADHGIDFPRLRELNPNIDAACGNIYPGEPLCIASK